MRKMVRAWYNRLCRVKIPARQQSDCLLQLGLAEWQPQYQWVVQQFGQQRQLVVIVRERCLQCLEPEPELQ